MLRCDRKFAREVGAQGQERVPDLHLKKFFIVRSQWIVLKAKCSKNKKNYINMRFRDGEVNSKGIC